MLITFHTRAYADITLFGDVAKSLLQMMGHSSSVPGALLAADIPAARARLQAALAAAQAKPAAELPEAAEEEPEEPPPPLALRARPLLELLAAAERTGSDVMWD